MEIEDFCRLFAEQFDYTDARKIKPSTNFRELEEWSSLIALSVLDMIQDEYNVLLKNEDMRLTHTVEDLYSMVKSKMK